MKTKKNCLKCGDEIYSHSQYCGKKIVNVCPVCKGEFQTTCNTKEKKVCSRSCTSIYANNLQAERRKNRIPVLQDCQMCGTPFEVKKKTKDGIVGCSPRCRFQLRVGPRNCAYCGKEFMPKSEISKCCSVQCAGKQGQTPEAKAKRIETTMERYGVENVYQSEEIKEKIKATTLKNFGVEYATQNPEIQAKMAQTNIERYGVRSPLQNKEILAKVQKTNIERYGDVCSLKNPEVKAKSQKTLMDKFGVDTPFKSKEIQAKVQATVNEKYEVDNVFQSEKIKTKIAETLLKNHGAENFSNSDTAKERLEERISKIIELFNGDKTEYEIAEIIGCEYITVRRVLLKNNLVASNNISKVNKYWSHLIKRELGVEFKHEGKIFDNKRQSVDLYNDDFKIAIDINPTVTHSTQKTVGHYQQPTSVKYHQERAINAYKNGWKLIQIFDWDSEEDILELLRSKLGLNEKIYARKCTVKEIGHNESKKFLDANHRQQGKANSSIQYGLFYNNELVQVMTFSKERFARNREKDDYELLRLTSKRGFTVVGGASKLFKAFTTSNYNPVSVKTYADFSKGDGNSYLNLGMTYEGFANLNAFYANIHTHQAFKVTEVTNKFKKEYENLGLSQKKFMNERNFYRINDAGNKIFVWKKHS